jgi:hypothetical protein
VLAAAVLAPLVVTAAATPWRGAVPNTHVALVLVLVIVAVAALGNRLAGVVAAVSAGLWFDVLWTQPYGVLVMTDPTDVETALLLLAVGVGVTELAEWGRRQQARSVQREAYLRGVTDAAAALSEGGSTSALIDRVCTQLTQVLGLQRCRFDYGTGLDFPRLLHDGSVAWRHDVLDVEATGFPDGVETELLVESGGQFRGRFLLTPRAGSRPSRLQRAVAAALADQVGAALAGYEAQQHLRHQG